MELHLPKGLHFGFGKLILPGMGEDAPDVVIENPLIVHSHELLQKVLKRVEGDPGILHTQALDVLSYIDFIRRWREGAAEYRYRIWTTLRAPGDACTSATRGFVMRLEFVVRDDEICFSYLPHAAQAYAQDGSFRTIDSGMVQKFAESLVKKYQNIFEKLLYEGESGGRRSVMLGECFIHEGD